VELRGLRQGNLRQYILAPKFWPMMMQRDLDFERYRLFSSATGNRNGVAPKVGHVWTELFPRMKSKLFSGFSTMHWVM
jgi:hypothetical protein